MMKTSGDQMWIMCPLLHMDRDVIFGNRHMSGGVDQVAKDVLRFGGLVALCHLAPNSR